ncbi:MAG: SRPBCC domain-containing protein [Ilumatobacter sp.]|nr:SRPBCC domain-containing protein [Ilumatobacter sp.]
MTEPRTAHSVEIELHIDGTLHDVWRAIATAGGISSWMMPTDLDPEPGGRVVFHMGPDFDSVGKVTHVEAERRFVYEEDWAAISGNDGAAVGPLVTEFLVEAHSGGSCTVRVVTSAFGTGAEWENEFFDELSAGWVPMLDNLRLYVEGFPGQTASTMWIDPGLSVAPRPAIEAVRDRFGVTAVGDHTERHGIEAVVERSIPHHVLLRVSTPVTGFFSFLAAGNDDEGGLGLVTYLFGDGADAYIASHEASWRDWLRDVIAEVNGIDPGDGS